MTTHEGRIFLMALGAGFPGSVIALVLLWGGNYTPKVAWTLTVFILVLWWGFALAVRERTVLPLQTIANLLEALREGDYSIRARQPRGEDALDEVMVEVNELGAILRSQRFDAVDAGQLLRKVIEEIDLAVFTFDREPALRLINPAGERMMAQSGERLLGRSAVDLGLDDCLTGEPIQTFERSFPGESGRWQCRRGSFREAGRPHQLLVLTDVSKALREEERLAWQRLIRVLGHELNNSLAPIKSTASTLAGVLRRDSPHPSWREDAQRGLAIIADRCESLNRFVGAYSRLARLPPPKLQPLPVGPIIHRVVAFEIRHRVLVDEGPPVVIEADRDQVEQVLINLVKNAVEAALETEADEAADAADEVDALGTAEISPEASEVSIGWRLDASYLEVWVRDRGPGIANPQNLFVPFFTTKPGGTGVGLVLCRQIAEAHGGNLTLTNRTDGVGCEACLRLPMQTEAQ